jgi:hypothetical protein
LLCHVIVANRNVSLLVLDTPLCLIDFFVCSCVMILLFVFFLLTDNGISPQFCAFCRGIVTDSVVEESARKHQIDTFGEQSDEYKTYRRLYGTFYSSTTVFMFNHCLHMHMCVCVCI